MCKLFNSCSLRTALTLARMRGSSETQIQQAIHMAEERLGLVRGRETTHMGRLLAQGDPYGRLKFLAEKVTSLPHYTGSQPLRVLDVGGGDGFLSVLLPQSDYVLVEPLVNGLNASELNFEKGGSDVVVLSHTLEHIARQSRRQVLSQLLSLSSGMLLILGPFAPPEGRPLTEESITEATGAVWAHDHLKYGLPSLDELCDHLENLRLCYDIIPHADARVMYWQFLAIHFAQLAGESQAIEGATEFYHRYYDYRPANPFEPHDFLVRVWLS